MNLGSYEIGDPGLFDGIPFKDTETPLRLARLSDLERGPIDTESQPRHMEALIYGILCCGDEGGLSLQQPGQLEQALRLIERGRDPREVVQQFKVKVPITDNTTNPYGALNAPGGRKDKLTSREVAAEYGSEDVDYKSDPNPRRGQVHGPHLITDIPNLATESTVYIDPRQILQEANGDGTTNSVLDASGFSSHDKNLLIFVYGRERVKQAISTYFGARHNVHEERTREQDSNTNLRQGLVATLEFARTREHGQHFDETRTALESDFDILTRMRDEYGNRRFSPERTLHIDSGKGRELTYLVNKFVFGRNVGEIPTISYSTGRLPTQLKIVSGF